MPRPRESWRSARARVPGIRSMFTAATRPRTLLVAGICIVAAVLFFRLSAQAEDVRRFYCFGPAKAPMDMTPTDEARWHAHHQTPVIFNHHKPVVVDDRSISHIDLNPISSTPRAAANSERILILTPLKDAAAHLARHFDHLRNLTYPHHLIDVAFLVGDSADDTFAVLSSELDRAQSRDDGTAFRSATVVRKDFGGAQLAMDVESRHGFAAQGPRRKLLGKIRNYLLATALRSDHAWVYWRDVDIEESAPTIIEDFVAHDRDILVPNIWFHRFYDDKGKTVPDIEGRFDYNSWIESEEGRSLRARLAPDVVLAEGYKEYATHRTYMAKMGDRKADPHHEIELDAIGGVNILVKADVHRSGVNFPAYAFENQAETEGFAQMAKRAGYGVYGLPNYVVWHVDTQEKPGNA